MTAAENVHATGILLGDAGVLIRGPSGSGKSLLGLLLLDRWEARGLPAQLVADDRVDILAAAGALLMRTPPAIAGLVELRGRGILRRPYAGQAQVALVVDLVDGLERMPEHSEFQVQLLGVRLPRCPVPRSGKADVQHQILLVVEALTALCSSALEHPEKTLESARREGETPRRSAIPAATFEDIE